MLNFKANFPLKEVTTLQIGGPAKKFVAVKTEEELIEAIKFAKANNLPYLIIGGGSNLLVADEGVNCVVVKNEIVGKSTSRVGPDSFEVCVKSGTPLQELIDYTINHGLSGLQKLTGIPGTVGGAIYGNAGAYGQSISDHLQQVVILTPHHTVRGKNLVTLSKNECTFNYRHSIFKKTKDIVIEAVFQLENGNQQALEKEAKDVLVKRAVKYPPGIKCPGSFFKNIVASEIPQEILKDIPQEKIVYGKLPAGALLEKVGAKGQTVDGIHIAPYHANLFINNGTGTAKAFYDLAKIYALKVKEKFGIILEPEVQLINLPPL